MKKIVLLAFTVFTGVSSFAQAPKKVLVEEYTGIWCGFCPKAATALEDCLNFHPNAVGIAMHVNDVISSSYSEAIATGFNLTGLPTGTVDRFPFYGKYVPVPYSNWKSRTTTRLNTPTPVAVNYTSTYNATTRVLNVTVYANFVGAASGDMRINCVLTEDSIVKTNSPQVNYYGNGCSNPDPNTVWYNFPCYIPNYVHDHVARTNLANTIWGSTGVIPANVTAGQNFSKNYTYTLPASWNPNKMHIVAFVNKHQNDSLHEREIMNTIDGHLINTTTGVQENPNIQQVEVKQNSPNPFYDITAIQFRLNTTDNVSVRVYDVLGKEIAVVANTTLIPGDHTFYWGGTDNNGNAVAAGMYYYTIATSSSQVSKPMILLQGK